MASAGRYLQRHDFVLSADQALDFIRSRLWRDGRLLAVYKDGKAHLAGYLDDYALLLDGILELLQLRWRDGELDFAIALAEVLLQHFQDTRKGGFYFTADDHEPLLQRPKPVYDEALPAGNGIVARVLLKLGHLLGSMPYLAAAERTLKWARPTLEQIPTACGALALALEDYYQPDQSIILQGPEDAIEPWRARCIQAYAPRRFTLTIPPTAGSLPGILATRAPQPMPVAYLCSGNRCSPPLTSLAALETALAATEIRPLQ
jgi:uncharacterized protein YyaL (SSP411 family)